MLYATYQLNDAVPVRISLTMSNAFAYQCPVKFLITSLIIKNTTKKYHYKY